MPSNTPSERPSHRLAEPETLPVLLLARTDGRTNGRATHLPETPSVGNRAGENEGFEVDSLTEFLLGCNPARVETERLGNFAQARRESFGHAAHRDMLAFHELQRARFRHDLSVNDAYLYRQHNHDPRRTAA